MNKVWKFLDKFAFNKFWVGFSLCAMSYSLHDNKCASAFVLFGCTLLYAYIEKRIEIREMEKSK